MAKLTARKRKDPGLPLDSAKSLELAVEQQFRLSSGTEAFKRRDPVHHINENFRRTFDFMGMQANKSRQGGEAPEAEGQTENTGRQAEEQGSTGSAARQAGKEGSPVRGGVADKRTDMGEMYKPSQGGDPDRQFADRFSQTAFSRGEMAGAVMRGTGDMMLLSCLKRTVGQSQPKNFRQRTLFHSGASAKRNISGLPNSKVVFNRGAVDGAVGVTVDALRNTRLVVDTLEKLAGGGNVLEEGSGAETLIKQYPFLSDAKERDLLERYNGSLGRLSGQGDAGRRAILEQALKKTQAIIDKKQQLRFNFIQHLRFISDRARQTIEVFEEESFRQALLSRLLEYSPAPAPPDDEGSGSGKDEEGGRFERIEDQ